MDALTVAVGLYFLSPHVVHFASCVSVVIIKVLLALAKNSTTSTTAAEPRKRRPVGENKQLYWSSRLGARHSATINEAIISIDCSRCGQFSISMRQSLHWHRSQHHPTTHDHGVCICYGTNSIIPPRRDGWITVSSKILAALRTKQAASWRASRDDLFMSVIRRRRRRAATKRRVAADYVAVLGGWHCLVYNNARSLVAYSLMQCGGSVVSRWTSRTAATASTVIWLWAARGHRTSDQWEDTVPYTTSYLFYFTPHTIHIYGLHCVHTLLRVKSFEWSCIASATLMCWS